MAYKDKFNRTIELELEDVPDTTRIVLTSLMREGELRFRDELVEVLENDIKGYLDEIGENPNTDWITGVQYVIHLLKEAEIVEY